MTLFEYIAVASSIILSFAVVRLLDTVPHAFSPARRSGVHSAFVIVVLWGSAQYWWVGWSLAEGVQWTYPKFLLYLAAPAVMYSIARTLSSNDPSEIRSFGDYFDEVHRRFFGLFAAYLLLLILMSWVLHDLPLLRPLRAFQVAALVFAGSGIFVRNRRFHGFLAAVFLAQLAIATFGLFTDPGGGLTGSP